MMHARKPIYERTFSALSLRSRVVMTYAFTERYCLPDLHPCFVRTTVRGLTVAHFKVHRHVNLSVSFSMEPHRLVDARTKDCMEASVVSYAGGAHRRAIRAIK